MKIAELGYLLVGAPDVAEWRNFGEKVLGTMMVDGPDGALYARIDERAFRIAILPGHDNGLLASGWLVADPDAFSGARAELQAAGVATVEGDAAGAALRKVQAYFSFKDPAGHAHEIAWGPISDFTPFVSSAGVSRFVTEGLGLGHVVLAAPDSYDAEYDFWTKTCGFGLSDILKMSMGGPMLRVGFLHCGNPRQHSLAIGELPFPGGCIHIMLEVGTIVDVGRALDRVEAHGAKLFATIGQHVNDDMVSFYVMTPGGFPLEYGCGDKQVDWSKHVAFETTMGDSWGHKFIQ